MGRDVVLRDPGGDRVRLLPLGRISQINAYFLSVIVGLGVLLDVCLLVGLPAVRTVTLDRDGLLLRRYSGWHKRVPWDRLGVLPKLRERKCSAECGSGPAFRRGAPCCAAHRSTSSRSSGRAASITSARRILSTLCGSYDNGGRNCSKVPRAASKRRRRLRRPHDDFAGGENTY